MYIRRTIFIWSRTLIYYIITFDSGLCSIYARKGRRRRRIIILLCYVYYARRVYYMYRYIDDIITVSVVNIYTRADRTHIRL